MEWVIIIIVAAVALVSHLASLSRQEQKVPPPPGRPGGENAMGRARPTTSEIDRFLEEVNRRKQQQQERRIPPPPVQQPPRVRAVIVDQPPPIVARPVRQVIVAEPVVQATIADEPDFPATPSMTLNQLANIQIPATVERQVESGAAKHAKAMLKTREGLRAMFVVNEILGPPRCRQAYDRRR